MTTYRKRFLIVVGIVGLLIISTIFKAVKRASIAEVISNVRYAELVDLTKRTKSIQRKKVPESVLKDIVDKFRAGTSVKILGRKSVVYGELHLLDVNSKPIVDLTILKFPLFQFSGSPFDGTQIELDFDLVGDLGFTIKDYGSSQAK